MLLTRYAALLFAIILLALAACGPQQVPTASPNSTAGGSESPAAASADDPTSAADGERNEFSGIDEPGGPGDSSAPASPPPKPLFTDWEDQIEFEEGTYELSVAASPGGLLYLDGELVFDGSVHPEGFSHTFSQAFDEGGHLFRLEYAEVYVGEPFVQILWEAGEPPYFEYSWQAGEELTGEVYLPVPIPRPVVVLDGEPTVILSTTAALRLADAYGIVLVDDEEAWELSTAGMLSDTVQRFSEPQLNTVVTKRWRVSLTNELLANDLEITPALEEAGAGHIRITKEAFARSNPALQPSVDGNPDRVFYSNRLTRAVLRCSKECSRTGMVSQLPWAILLMSSKRSPSANSNTWSPCSRTCPPASATYRVSKHSPGGETGW